jgi:hypothetical protein
VPPVGSFRSLVPHSLHSPTSCTAQQEKPVIPFLPILIGIHSIPCYTCFLPTHNPNAGKAVFVNRSIWFHKNISARVNALPSVALAYTIHYLSVCAPVGAHFKSFICFVSHIPLNPHSQLFYPPKPRFRCSLNSQVFNWGAIAAYCFARLRVAAG